jgi:hypothetical protein
MIRHWQRNAAVVHERLETIQRKPAGPQTAFGALPTQTASLQAPQSSVAVA